jgi:hypothetical protein
MSRLASLRCRLTYANVMSSIAVFVALGGGAYAISIPKESVGARQLKPNAVSSKKVKDRSLTADDFKRGQLPALRGAKAAGLDPMPVVGTVVKQTTLTVRQSGRVWVQATVHDVFLTCTAAGPCSAEWGVYVDGKPVPGTGLKLEAAPEASDGFGFYALYGISSEQLAAGSHQIKLARTGAGSIATVGELGSQLGALTFGG